MNEEQLDFIKKLIKKLGDEDWDKWAKEEIQTMDSMKISQNDAFFNNLHKKILHEMNKLCEE